VKKAAEEAAQNAESNTAELQEKSEENVESTSSDSAAVEVDVGAEKSAEPATPVAPTVATASSTEEPKTVEKEEKKESEKGSVKIAITSERTREIEREIAKNTAKFDASVVKSDDKAATDAAKAELKAKLLRQMALKASRVPLQAYQVMRFIRLAIIIALAVFTGYQSAVTNMDEVQFFSFKRQQAIKESAKMGLGTATGVPETALDIGKKALSEFISTATGARPVPIDMPQFSGAATAQTSTKTKTWVEWLHRRITSQLQCSLSAVWLVWWVSGFIAPLVDRVSVYRPVPYL
jgi:hypothetical protein